MHENFDFDKIKIEICELKVRQSLPADIKKMF